MPKNFLEIMGRIAVFRRKEQALGEAQADSGVSMVMDTGSGLSLDRDVEDDRDQIRGAELATRLFYSGHTVSGRLSQKRVKPDLLNFVLAYFFGEARTQEVGSGIYEHIITPSNLLTLPSFTLTQRRGDSILKERYSGNLIDGFSLELGESWVSLSADVKGIGKRETNYYHEVVKANANSSQLTLSQNGVEGEGEGERIENVFRVRARDVGSNIWKLAKVIGVSQGAPAVITLQEPISQSSELIDFHIDYIPTEPDWCDFPAELDESPLRLVDARVIVDGYFDGNDVSGGEVISNDLLNFSIQGKNGLEIRKLADWSGAPWASDAVRSQREITIKISERLRNTILQWQADHPETEQISVYLRIRGAEIIPQSGYYFGADFIFPKCGILNLPVSLNGKFLAQDGDLIVMDDETHSGVFIRTWNKVSNYLG